MSLRKAETLQVVAIDADGTIVNFAQGVTDYAYRTRQAVYNPEQIHPDPSLNGDFRLFEIIRELLDQPEEVEKLSPYPGAVEGLHILHEEGYDSQLVSVRDASILEQATRNWAQMHGCLPYLSGFHLSGGWDYGSLFKVGKAHELGIVAAFDDDDHIVYSYAIAGIPVIHIKNPNIPPSLRSLRLAEHPLVSQHPSFLLGVRAFVENQKALKIASRD